jgi:hypothetical protein
LWGVLDKGKGGAEAKGAGVDEGDLYGEFCLVEFCSWGVWGLRRREGGGHSWNFWGLVTELRLVVFVRSLFSLRERKRQSPKRVDRKEMLGFKNSSADISLSQPNQRNSANAPPKPCESAPC